MNKRQQKKVLKKLGLWSTHPTTGKHYNATMIKLVKILGRQNILLARKLEIAPDFVVDSKGFLEIQNHMEKLRQDIADAFRCPPSLLFDSQPAPTDYYSGIAALVGKPNTGSL